MPKNRKCQKIEKLFKTLCNEKKYCFPQPRERLCAPRNHGVYIIRKSDYVLHVGRTLRGNGGLRNRLNGHLHGNSSFAIHYLIPEKISLRNPQCTYQYLELKDNRDRAYLEAYAIGRLCPEHIGLGERLDG